MKQELAGITPGSGPRRPDPEVRRPSPEPGPQGPDLEVGRQPSPGRIHKIRRSDGGGPSTPHHGSQDPRLDRDEHLDSRRERLGHDEGRLHMERLGGSLDRLGPITRSMAKHIHAQMDLP